MTSLAVVLHPWMGKHYPKGKRWAITFSFFAVLIQQDPIAKTSALAPILDFDLCLL